MGSHGQGIGHGHGQGWGQGQGHTAGVRTTLWPQHGGHDRLMQMLGAPMQGEPWSPTHTVPPPQVLKQRQGAAAAQPIRAAI